MELFYVVSASDTAKATMADDILDTKIRHIRNVQISNEDLKCLLPSQKLKLPSSTINAYGAWVQKQGEDLSEVSSACAISFKVPGGKMLIK